MQTVEEKRAYNRSRQKKVYDRFKERRKVVFERLGNECFLCRKKAEIGFHLHHAYYHPTESDYPRHSKAMNVRLKRLKEAENNIDRFRLLCPSCHHFIGLVEFKIIDKENLLSLL